MGPGRLHKQTGTDDKTAKICMSTTRNFLMPQRINGVSASRICNPCQMAAITAQYTHPKQLPSEKPSEYALRLRDMADARHGNHNDEMKLQHFKDGLLPNLHRRPLLTDGASTSDCAYGKVVTMVDQQHDVDQEDMKK